MPYIAHAARHARGIVVHSPFVERYLRAFGCRTPIYVVPHPVVERDEDVRRAERRAPVLRGSLEAMGMKALLGVFGDRNAAKLIDIVLAAVARLPESVHLVLVGRPILGYDPSRWYAGAVSGLASRFAPTFPTTTSWRGCARPTSRSTCAFPTAARSPAHSCARCSVAARRS